MDGDETLPAFPEAAARTDAEAAEGQAAAVHEGATNGTAPEEKKRRGRPKDLNAPKRPQTPKAKVQMPARERLRTERPELATDLKGMFMALNEVWEQVPQEEKDKLQKEYEEEMEIWKPKWEAYKKTDSYKEFCLLKQEYKDKKEKKKFLKAESKKAPKRPKSGYALFCDEIRDRVKEEVMAKGGSMGDIGKKMSEEWNAVPETKKAEYQEMSQAQKEEFQVKFAEYKTTQDFKDFQLKKAKMDGRHALNALTRTTHKDAPTKPANAFSLWKAKHLKEVMEEKKGASAGELSKIMGEKWKNATPEEKEPFENEAAALKEEYKKKVADFKRQKNYITFLQKRSLVKTRENRQVNLRDMPKKPKTVYALFREDIKEEVPTGKGEGKGMNFVKNKFQEMEDEKKLIYKQKEAELREKYDEEMKTYKEGETYKTFEKQNGKIKRELMTEGMKVMTLKFLSDAPAEPPKNAFAEYVGEKRRAAGEAGAPKKRTRGQIKEEVAQLKADWSKLDKDAQNVYEEKRMEKRKKWEEEVKAYMELPKWKEYIEEAKSLKVPVRSLLSSKKKAIKKLKNGMKLQPLPDRPESMPTKPAKARRIYFLEKRKEVDDPSKLQEMWDALSEEEKSTYSKKEAELALEYQEALNAFRTSEEGKQYVRKVKQIQKSRATAIAKDKFLVDMPKKPLGHLQLYTRDKVKELKKVKPDLKGADLKAEITNSWKALSDEEKKVYEDKGNQLLTEYEANLSEFKATENFKKYASTIKRLSHKPKASSGAPKKPGTMPAKPPDALKLYKDELGAGKKTSELVAAFQELPAEEKAKYRGRAEEAKKEFEDQMKEWKSTEEGKKYIKETRAFEKRRKLTNARHKFLKDEPKRPPNATLLFCNEKRSEYAAQFPGLKGLQLNGKMAEIYRGMSAEDKKEFEDKAKERQEEYLEKLQEFKESSDYKKYLNAIKAKPAGKAKAKAATKDKKKGPAPPASMPKKPGTAMTLFMKQNKGGGTLAKQSQAFKELPEEERKRYAEEASKNLEEYNEEMEAFKKTAEGKRYFRLKAASEKKSRIETAKKKYLEDAKPPKSAPSAYQLFVQEKRPALQSAGKSMQEVAKELTTTWRSLTVEEQKPFEERADKAKAEYEEQLEAYRSSPGYKKFEKFKSSINRKPTKKTKKPKAKAKGRAKAKAKGRGRQKEPEKKADNSSTSDVMGSDSDSSSSSSGSD